MAKYGGDCICPQCPSYTTCARVRSQRIFCVAGKSPTNCIRSERGCLCPECEVSRILDMSERYYCIYGDDH